MDDWNRVMGPWNPDRHPETYEPGCHYCERESEPGWLETDNNGPIVPCPFCNSDGTTKPRA